MKDTYRHRGLRRMLIESLRKKGIHNDQVLDAMTTIPRHFFIDKAFEEKAYQDIAFPIGNEQTISQPYTVALMTDLLQIEKRHKVLEIGTGSGYQATILAKLGARVYTIERQEELFNRTQQLLSHLGYPQIRMYWRDGYKGLPEFAPFDRIIVTAGAPEYPELLAQQLKENGIMVVPIGKEEQTMHRITRLEGNNFKDETLVSCKFVPFLKGRVSSKTD
ncbi:MAG: protein-L-isoaspartate(D-aspartate) O-methyltransferase [Saprospiraceae bacterium]|nr:protein-L-isoaspartate(D-aspartate) O-methyltransferase [Saprospiraceae bacterium]